MQGSTVQKLTGLDGEGGWESGVRRECFEDGLKNKQMKGRYFEMRGGNRDTLKCATFVPCHRPLLNNSPLQRLL